MMAELIRDNGKVRNCPSNHLKMSLISIAWNFHSYKKIVKAFPIADVKDALIILLQLPLYVLLFPVLPIIYAWTTKSRARREYHKSRADLSDD
jgi:hypothetical protein